MVVQSKLPERTFVHFDISTSGKYRTEQECYNIIKLNKKERKNMNLLLPCNQFTI